MSHALERAKASLLNAARRAKPNAVFDAAGYSLHLEDNLIEGVSRNQFETDYLAAAGQELGGKMKAAHSSAALVVNAFAPWKERVSRFALAGVTEFNTLRFEAVYPTGLGGTPPHLDLVASGSTSVAVESKCLEYLTPKSALFSRSYDTIADSRCDSPWFGLINLLRTEPNHYRYLDVAQLVKHSLGLMKASLAGEGILLYVHWEPVNHCDFQEFHQHRDEIGDLQSILRGSRPAFKSLTYAQIWNDWATESSEPWLKTHVDRVRQRYAVAI